MGKLRLKKIEQLFPVRCWGYVLDTQMITPNKLGLAWHTHLSPPWFLVNSHSLTIKSSTWTPFPTSYCPSIPDEAGP